ncbi:MAG: hypothetical protein Q4D41_12885 [Prevotellaceae bacterium]|nr:hypothetical protein [Prevotellaceae bacterium]
MPIKLIAKEVGVSAGALSAYIRRHHRELVLKRYNIDTEGKDLNDIKIISAGEESERAKEKYKDAVNACASIKYIELNMSQLARMFNLSGTGLANYMKVHYRNILKKREKMQQKLGLHDKTALGAKKECKKQYAKAIKLYKTTNMTLPEIAEICEVSESGLSQHLRFYHNDILTKKREERKQAKEQKKKTRGDMNGNGRKSEPKLETEEKYAKALELYRDTPMSMKEIALQTGVTSNGLRFYLHKWHIDLVYERAGITDEIGESIDLRKDRKRSKTTKAKYERAIEFLKKTKRTTTEVSTLFGFNPEVFRQYLHKYEPELATEIGMTRNYNGKLTLSRSQNKYKEAIEIYRTTSESLRTIAKRLGLTYKSLDGYIRRNHLDVIQSHKMIVEKNKTEKKEVQKA